MRKQARNHFEKAVLWLCLAKNFSFLLLFFLQQDKGEIKQSQ